MAREITIEAEWTHFRMLDIAANAPPVQVREMKKAFYAGAMSGIKMVAVPEATRMSPRNRELMYIAFLDEARRWAEEFALTSGRVGRDDQ